MESTAEETAAAAQQGVASAPQPLPHRDVIQRAFGRHDISSVRAHIGGDAQLGARAMGAHAYATGDRVAFAAAPDLHTAAHEAAHVVQQRGGRVAPGLGAADSTHEAHADRVADLVVRGQSAEAALDEAMGGGSPVTAVQRRIDLRTALGTKQGLSVAEAKRFLGQNDREYGTTYKTQIEADPALQNALQTMAASGEVLQYGFLQAGDLFTEIRVRAKRAIRHDGQVHDVTRTLREAADSVYQVAKGGQASVIKQHGGGRGAALANESAMMDAVQGHENVIATQGLSGDGSQIKMEYVPHGMLRDYQAQGEAQSKRIASGIIAGLSHMHAHSVVHGDLDNKNIFIGGTHEQPVAKIADLGSASRGAATMRLNACTDVTGATTVLRQVVLPYLPAGGSPVVFNVAVQAVQTEASDLARDTQASQPPDYAGMGMTAESYAEMMGGPPQLGAVPDGARTTTLLAHWAALANQAWLV